ncbi:acyl carrier protein [Paenibacillus sp. SC116]|uniref:Acyl carrier protein n=1 Tax=Paenibacillus agilis TaxID=3020863 RepID=A0A559IVK4_9BACL|nr:MULTISPECIES: acyl carrier protein [Paenibacillus]MCR8844311.1 acyl carrier protein [Paenibacillus sp. SC116]TVX91668.1 acyl carrier protein [Paenibacillus agilis]
MTKDDIILFLKMEIAAVLEQDHSEIDEDVNFLKIGVSSIQALKIINRARKKLDIDISPVALFEYKTIAEFSGYLHECMSEKVV